MEIDHIRLADDGAATLSVWLIDGRFACHVLEDPYQPIKIRGNTRIPDGRYEIVLRTEGGLHSKYSDPKRSPQIAPIHKGMLWIRMPGGPADQAGKGPEVSRINAEGHLEIWTWIQPHIGNYHRNTDGCPLLGRAPNPWANPLWVSNSTDTYLDVYPVIAEALLDGDTVGLNVRNLDHELSRSPQGVL